ncbi:MAG: ATP-binding protein [Candidatus Limnocylindria bacterium]
MAVPVTKPIREERRLVTCMFVDVVGSTELTMSLGAERLKRELGAAFGDLSGIITSHGGTVEKYVGDAIYAIFGAPVAHEDDPLRAVRAAEALREWATTGSFAVRIGVETGEAVIDLEAAASTRQQMSVGPVVNIAARLQQRAEPGEVLVGPTCAAAAEAAELAPLGEFELKGVGRVPVFRLVRVGVAPERRLPFVGRSSELDLLAAAVRRARSGRAVLVLVSGPPGQGKTRLVRELVDSLGADATVLLARCRPSGEIGALAPLRELLGVADDAELGARVGSLFDPAEAARIAGALAHSAGLSSSPSLGALGAAERDDEIANAWRRYLAALGRQRLLALWLEDVHWADPAIVRLTDRLTLGGGPLLIIATARPEFAEQAGLRPSGDRFFIELEGLETEDSRRLAASAGRADERAISRAEGNPLFVIELARARPAAEEMPLTLQGALGARLDELEPADRALLSSAAVAGETFTAADAAFLARRDPGETRRALAMLTDRHYVDAIDGSYRFHHSLLRDVAYSRLLTAERMNAHARYARDRLADDVEARAHHWSQALRPPDAEWVWQGSAELPQMRREAFAALLAAGKRQGTFFAPERAAALLQRALDLAEGPADRAAAERTLADAYARDLRGDEAWAHYRAALAAYREAGAVPPDFFLGPLKVRTRWGAFREFPPPEELHALTREAEQVARAGGDESTLARVLVYSAFEDLDPAASPGDRVRIDEAVRLAERSGDVEARREVLGWFANQLMRELDLDGAVRVLDEVEALGPPDDLDLQDHLRGRALVAMRLGDLNGLNALADRLVEVSRRMGPHLRTHADVYAAYAALARGDWAEVERIAHATARLVEEAAATRFCGSAGMTVAVGAASHAKAGRFDEARALVRTLDARGYDWSEQSPVARPFALALTGASVVPPAPSENLAPFVAFVAVARRDHDRALKAAAALERASAGGARFYRALADAVLEEVAADRGGPTPEHAGLLQIGYVGWSDLLRRRVDAEY